MGAISCHVIRRTVYVCMYMYLQKRKEKGADLIYLLMVVGLFGWKRKEAGLNENSEGKKKQLNCNIPFEIKELEKKLGIGGHEHTRCYLIDKIRV